MRHGVLVAGLTYDIPTAVLAVHRQRLTRAAVVDVHPRQRVGARDGQWDKRRGEYRRC